MAGWYEWVRLDLYKFLPSPNFIELITRPSVKWVFVLLNVTSHLYFHLRQKGFDRKSNVGWFLGLSLHIFEPWLQSEPVKLGDLVQFFGRVAWSWFRKSKTKSKGSVYGYTSMILLPNWLKPQLNVCYTTIYNNNFYGGTPFRIKSYRNIYWIFITLGDF